jgi:RNA polymerase sigma factor (TIGR02999 family)
MGPGASDQITQLLRSWSNGDNPAMNAVIPLVYSELRRLAESYLRRERPDHTLQPTALIHEAYLRLAGQKSLEWQNRSHFYGVVAHLMRQILTDYARTHVAAKRGNGDRKLTLDEHSLVSNSHPEDLLALEEALAELARVDKRKCRVVEMRFFAGMTPEATAEALGVSEPTIRREFRLARAFLRQHLTLKNGANSV